MKSQTLGSRTHPGVFVTVTGPDEIELPAQLTVRLPGEDFESVTLWWHYDKDGNDTRTLAEGYGRHD